jgi:hypothetical protein
MPTPSLSLALGLALLVTACSAGRAEAPPPEERASRALPDEPPPPPGPRRLELVRETLLFQDRQEPHLTEASFPFELRERPRRARLLLRYTGVPGATSQDYLQGRFRHRVELNGTFLMDLNTFSDGEAHLVQYTKWIPAGLFRKHNSLRFQAGDDGGPGGQPARDEFELRSAVLEFDW